MRRLLLVVAMLLVAVPAPAAPIAHREVLGNGIVLLVAERPAVPLVTVRVFSRAGAVFDPPDRAGLANLTGRVLTRGTARRSAQQIDAAIEFVGGRLEAGAGRDGLTTSLSVLRRDLGLGLDLLQEVVLSPGFPDAEVQRKIREIQAAIQRSEENPEAVASRALNRLVSAAGVVCPVLGSVQRSNEVVVERSVNVIHHLGVRNIALIGLSFKPGTDDLRESPLVELAERLLGKGYRLRIFDPDVRTESLMGRNLQYVNEHLQHLTSLLCGQAGEALADSQLIVVGKPLLPLERIIDLCASDARILDIIRCFPLNSGCSKLLRLSSTEEL